MAAMPDPSDERWVDLAAAADPEQVGGKAARLGELIRHGLRVPAGLVVTTATHRDRRAGAANGSTLAESLRAHLRERDPDRLFAVRSSATVEDSARASFAGQFRSLLNVRREDVPEAVARVQDSVDNPSAAAYARRMGIAAPQTLAVIVQEQVAARLSGVCFSVDPVSGAATVLIEYAEGLGDEVVGGRALPDGVQRFRRDGGIPELIADPEGEGHADLVEVARTAVHLERLLGVPQDMEWAVDETGLWILQARPITTLVHGGESGL